MGNINNTINTNLVGSSGSPISASNPLPTERPEVTVTPAISIETISGSVAAGKYSVSLVTSSDFSGTILGAVAEISTTYEFSTDYNAVLAAISYTITTGSLTILSIS